MCKCNDATKYGEACDKSCTGESKKTEVASDFSECVCPGTNAGKKFSKDDCETCLDEWYPKKTCDKQCDSKKLMELKADDTCVACSDTQKYDNKKCVNCGTNEVKSEDGKDCRCPINSHFKVQKSCGGTDVCKEGYIPKGTCTTKCTSK